MSAETLPPAPYFLDRARLVMRRAGGDAAVAGPLAEWAHQTRLADDLGRGVIVALDGTLVADTEYVRTGDTGARYVRDADAQRLDLWATEVGMALARLSRTWGPLIHVRAAEVAYGPGGRAR